MAERVQNVQFLIYPDSCDVPAFLEYVEQLHIECYVSPLHDMDVREDGSLKKSHHHVVALLPSLKSKAQIKELFGEWAANGAIQNCLSPRGCVRYLCHLDNPDKAPYKIEDMRCFCPEHLQDYLDSKNKNVDERTSGIRSLLAFIIENGVKEFAYLVDTLLATEEHELFEELQSNVYFVKEYLFSIRRIKEMEDKPHE